MTAGGGHAQGQEIGDARGGRGLALQPLGLSSEGGGGVEAGMQ